MLFRSERCKVIAYYGQGANQEMQAHSTLSLRYFGEAIPATRAAYWRGLLWQLTVRMLQSVFPSLIVRSSPKRRDTAREAATVLDRLFDVFIHQGDPLPAVYTGVRSLNLAETIGPTQAQARSLTMMGLVLSATPFQRSAQRHISRALRIADEVGDPPTQAHCYLRAAAYSMSHCAWEECADRLARAFAIATAAKDQRSLEEHCAIASASACMRSDFAAAVKSGREGEVLAARRGDRQTEAWAASALSLGLLRLGQAQEAVAVIDQVLPWVDTRGTPIETILTYGHRALGKFELGQYPAALADAERALEWMLSVRLLGYFFALPVAAIARVFHGVLARDARTPEVTRALLEKARVATGLLVRLAKMCPFALPSSLLAQGSQTFCEGNHRRAERYWRRALGEAQRKQISYEASYAHSLLATLDVPDRATHAQLALDGFLALGCVGDALRVRERSARYPTSA